MNDSTTELDKVLVVEVDAVASLVIAATDRAAAVAASLNRAMADIAEASKIIRALAAQGKLLGLNASIEAARSGEEGNGFGVVASEVRALAVRSAGCADIIDDLVAVVLQGLDRNDDVVRDLNVAVERGMAVVTTMTAAANIPSSFSRS